MGDKSSFNDCRWCGMPLNVANRFQDAGALERHVAHDPVSYPVHLFIYKDGDWQYWGRCAKSIANTPLIKSQCESLAW